MRLTENKFGMIINRDLKPKGSPMYMDSTGTIIRYKDPYSLRWVLIIKPKIDNRSIFFDVTEQGIERRMVNSMDRHAYHIRKEIETKQRVCSILDHVWYKEDVWTDDEVATELWVCDRCGKQEKREPLKGASDR